MSGIEKIKEFEKRRYDLVNELRRLNMDMMGFCVAQHDPRIMTKRVDKIEIEINKLSYKLYEATEKMERSKCCILNEYREEV